MIFLTRHGAQNSVIYNVCADSVQTKYICDFFCNPAFKSIYFLMLFYSISYFGTGLLAFCRLRPREAQNTNTHDFRSPLQISTSPEATRKKYQSTFKRSSLSAGRILRQKRGTTKICFGRPLPWWGSDKLQRRILC